MGDAGLDGEFAEGAGDRAPTAFWAQGYLGRSSPWLFIGSFLLIAVIYLGGSIALFFAFEAFSPDPYLDWDVQDWRDVPTATALFGFTVFMATFVILLLAAFFANRVIHRRGPRSLITVKRRFRWPQAAASFAVVFLLACALLGLDLLIWPDKVTYVLDPKPFFVFLPAVLILVSLQVFAEEVVFRGYLLQLVGRLCARPFVLVLVPATLFWAGHLWNDPVEVGGVWAVLDYAVFSLYATYLALVSDGLEHAFGIHLGTNFFVFLVLGSEGIWYPTPTLFLASETDFALSFLATLLIFTIHYLAVIRPGRALVSRAA